MDGRKQVMKLAELNNGTVLLRAAKAEGISSTCLSRMVASGELERIGRGIYALPTAVEDQVYLLQQKYPKLVVSHESALYYHDLCDVTPHRPSVTLPSGYQVPEPLKSRSKIYNTTLRGIPLKADTLRQIRLI